MQKSRYPASPAGRIMHDVSFFETQTQCFYDRYTPALSGKNVPDIENFPGVLLSWVQIGITG
jgi:hypothetical protein